MRVAAHHHRQQQQPNSLHLPVYAVAFNPKDRDIVWIGQGKVLEKWSIGTQKKLETKSCCISATIRGICFDEDYVLVYGGREVCICFADGRMKSQRFLDYVIAVKIYHGMIFVVLGHGQGHVLLPMDLRIVYDWESPNNGLIFSAHFFTRAGNDGLYLALGTIFEGIFIYCVEYGQKGVNLPMIQSLSGPAGHKGSIFDIATSPDGKLLASVSDDRSTRVWDIQTSGHIEPMRTFLGHKSRIWKCAFVQENSLVTAGEDGVVRLYHLDTPEDHNEGSVLMEHDGSVWSLASSEKCIVAGCEDGSVQFQEIHAQPINLQTVSLEEKKGPKHLEFSTLGNLQILFADGLLIADAAPIPPMLLEKHAIFMTVEAGEAEIIVAGNLEGKLILANGEKIQIIDLGISSQVIFLRAYYSDSSKNLTILVQAGDRRIKRAQIKANSLAVGGIVELFIDSTVLTSICFISETDFLIGSRDGRIISVQNLTWTVLSRLGKDAITFICPYETGFLVCDRSGTLYNCRIDSKLLVIWSRKLSKGWLEQIEIFEDEKMVIVGGFYGTRFFIMDAMSEKELYSTETGGAHRVWKLRRWKDPSKGRASLKFAFIRLGKVYSACIPIASIAKATLRKGLHGKVIRSICLYSNPNDDWLISGGEDDRIKCSSRDFTTITLSNSQVGDIKSIRLVDDCIFTVGSGGIVTGLRIIDPRKPFQCFWTSQIDSADGIRLMDVDVMVKSSYHLVVVAGSDSYLRLFCTNNNKEITKLAVHPFRCILKCCFVTHEDYIFIISGGTDGRLVLSSICEVSMNVVHSIPIHQNGINALATTGNLIASGGDDGTICISQLINLDKSPHYLELLCRQANAHHSTITGLVWINQETLASASIDCRICIWSFSRDEKTIKLDCTLISKVADIGSIALSRVGERLLYVAGCGVEAIELQRFGHYHGR